MVAASHGNPPILPETANTEAWRRAEIPSANGFGNARSVAAVQSVLANGGQARGVRQDQVLGTRMRWGMGYGVQGRSCSWGGWGGSIVMADLDTHLTVSYVMNQILEEGALGDDRGLSMILAAYAGLKNAG